MSQDFMHQAQALRVPHPRLRAASMSFDTEQANQRLLKHRISLFECNGLGNQIEVGSMQCRWFFTSRGGVVLAPGI